MYLLILKIDFDTMIGTKNIITSHALTENI